MGFSPPVVTQLSVFLTNKVGRLFDLVEAFDGVPTNICALSVHEASDHAVVRLITSNAADARKILRNANMPFTEKDVLVVEMNKDRTLANMAMNLLRAELSIHFAYPLILAPGRSPAMALAVDDLTLAGQILQRKEFKLLGEADLSQP
jgi:hypothetical protein